MFTRLRPPSLRALDLAESRSHHRHRQLQEEPSLRARLRPPPRRATALSSTSCPVSPHRRAHSLPDYRSSAWRAGRLVVGCGAKSVIFNAKFIVLNAKFIICNTNPSNLANAWFRRRGYSTALSAAQNRPNFSQRYGMSAPKCNALPGTHGEIVPNSNAPSQRWVCTGIVHSSCRSAVGAVSVSPTTASQAVTSAPHPRSAEATSKLSLEMSLSANQVVAENQVVADVYLRSAARRGAGSRSRTRSGPGTAPEPTTRSPRSPRHPLLLQS